MGLPECRFIGLQSPGSSDGVPSDRCWSPSTSGPQRAHVKAICGQYAEYLTAEKIHTENKYASIMRFTFLERLPWFDRYWTRCMDVWLKKSTFARYVDKYLIPQVDGVLASCVSTIRYISLALCRVQYSDRILHSRWGCYILWFDHRNFRVPITFLSST